MHKLAFAAALALAFAAGPGPASQASQPAATPTRKPKAEKLPADSVAAARAVSSLRAAQGLPPVKADAMLTRAAEEQASAMAAATTMSHSVAGDLGSRLRRAGSSASSAAENVAMGQRDLSEVMASWTQSSGHLSNMLMPSISRIGLARRKGADGRLYWAMVLAAPEQAAMSGDAPGGVQWGVPFLMFP
jgi:uncharacterized protein YkwD